jgi:hypothetical protein
MPCVLIVVFAGWPAWSRAVLLPDGRMYELVSPAQKSGGAGGVFPLGELAFSEEQSGNLLQSSVTGSAVTYLGEDFYRPRLGSIDQYLSQRTPAGGWLTQNITPGIPSPIESAVGTVQYVGLSPNLSTGIIGSGDLLAKGAPAGFANLFIQEGTSIQPLITMGPPNRKPASTFGRAWYGRNSVEPALLFAGANAGDGSTAPFSHVLFEANDALTPSDGLRPAAVDGGEFENNLYEWVDGGLRLVNILPNGETHPNASFGIDYGDIISNKALPNLSHVISADGTRIFWTDETTGDLYVREDGERTTLIANGGEYQTASEDGSVVLFTKEGNLYKFDTTAGVASELAGGGGVLGLVGASDNGSYVYLVSTSCLTSCLGKEPANEPAEGKPNLYLAHGGTLGFIATLSPEDDETPNIYGTAKPFGDWVRTFAGRTAEVSPDGQYVAFVARESLTGYENRDANIERNDYEIFLYDAATRKLACASCNTDGTQPTSHSLLPPPVDGVYQQRYLTDAGQLFFSTKDAVLPQDTNSRMDVYEYESGHVYLISPGNADDEAVFADASEKGEDAFFTTEQRLVPSDLDEITDLYDAHVGGHPEETASVSPCSGEACHVAPIAPPSFEAPPSAVFSGSGNLAPHAAKLVNVKQKTTGTNRIKRKHHGHARKHGRLARKGRAR